MNLRPFSRVAEAKGAGMCHSPDSAWWMRSDLLRANYMAWITPAWPQRPWGTQRQANELCAGGTRPGDTPCDRFSLCASNVSCLDE